MGPVLLLCIVPGVLHACLFVIATGRAGRQLVLILVASVVGSVLGQAIGGRFGDPDAVGDVSLVWTALGAWTGIMLVAALGLLVPARRGG
jgi:hypothetical protein